MLFVHLSPATDCTGSENTSVGEEPLHGFYTAGLLRFSSNCARGCLRGVNIRFSLNTCYETLLSSSTMKSLRNKSSILHFICRLITFHVQQPVDSFLTSSDWSYHLSTCTFIPPAHWVWNHFSLFQMWIQSQWCVIQMRQCHQCCQKPADWSLNQSVHSEMYWLWWVCLFPHRCVGISGDAVPSSSAGWVPCP